jgi:hypothetical protein
MNQRVYNMGLISDPLNSIDEFDFFILSSGSDNRAYEVLFNCTQASSSRVMMLHFNERLDGLPSDDALFDYKHRSFSHLQEISCEIKNPSSCLEEIKKNNFNANSKVAIDISCLTKPYFFFIIKLLKELFFIKDLSVFYTEPKSYLFPKGVFNAFHTNSGPLIPWEIPGFGGYEERGAKRKLIILLGFDGDLSKEINEDVSPTDTIVVNGFPSYTPKFKDISLIANEKLVSDHKIIVKYARANNPFEVYNLLQKIKDKEPLKCFINVAPLGTKPMALGACLFALHHPDVRILYPLPEFYENKYSDQSWNSWIYNLPLFNN